MTTDQQGPITVDEEDRAAFMTTLRDAMYDHGDMELLARWTGRSLSCIHAIRSGRTKWPQWKTTLPLARHLGLRVTLSPRRNT